jgi:hypothetical protein
MGSFPTNNTEASVKRFTLSIVCGFAIVALSFTAAQASPPSITGTWSVQQTGVNGTTAGTVTLTQSGNSFVGTGKNGNGYSGTFVSDTQINGKWHGPGGAGWLTVFVSPNGHSFNGTWGYNGRPSNGSFIGNQVLPPSPITAAGRWVLKGAGNAGGFIGPMTCTQSGRAVVCHVGALIVMNGAFKTNDKVRSKWTSSRGSGWFSFWFNDDNNSFNGTWGNGADTTPPIGRVVGQRQL